MWLGCYSQRGFADIINTGKISLESIGQRRCTCVIPSRAEQGLGEGRLFTGAQIILKTACWSPVIRLIRWAPCAGLGTLIPWSLGCCKRLMALTTPVEMAPKARGCLHLSAFLCVSGGETLWLPRLPDPTAPCNFGSKWFFCHVKQHQDFVNQLYTCYNANRQWEPSTSGYAANSKGQFLCWMKIESSLLK